MPRGDGTGPIGTGPMTGRGLGYCLDGGAGRLAGLSFGRGRGPRMTGFWRRGGACATALRLRDEEALLRERATYLKNELRLVEKRLEDIRPAGG